VEMEQAVTELEEVVAVGYGTQKKVNLSGSVSNVDVDEEMENRPITDISQALGGTASGVWASQTSGQPGNDQAQIRIRGWGTLNNANPLVIIDGVEGSFDDVNPKDIEDISVLKDAASAAIYGSKAANGVILITTKEGEYDQELEITSSHYGGIQQLGRRYDMVTNSVEHMKLWNQSFINQGLNPPYSEDKISEWRQGTGEDPYRYPSTDWYEEVFSNAPMQEHNVSIRGGSSDITAFISLNYLDQRGIVKNTSSSEYRLRANLEAQPVEWLTVGSKFNYKSEESKEPYRLHRTWWMLQNARPQIAPYTEDGRFGAVQLFDEGGEPVDDNQNPLIDNNNGRTVDEDEMANIQVNAEIKFTDNLNTQINFSSRRSNGLTTRWNENIFGYTTKGHTMMTKNLNREGIERIRNHGKSTDNDLYTTLNYDKEDIIAPGHDLSVIAGIQYVSNTTKNLYGQKNDPPKDNLTQIDAGTSRDQASGTMWGMRTFSYFGRLNYTLLDKYLFEFNLRRDASSRFKKGDRWGTFPGFSAAWRLSEEQFIQNLNVFSNLKLRFSYGRLGNQNIAGSWPYLTTINQNNGLSYSYNESFSPGAAVTSLVDPNITWESSTSTDIGIDMGFLDNRLIIGANYFNKLTSDIIVQLPIPNVMGGVSPPYENEGEMVNKGFELEFNYRKRAQQRAQLGLNINANLTYTYNEVTKFRGGDSPDQLFLIREGYSYNALYGYNAIGIYQSDEDAAQHMHSNAYTPQAGELKYEDVNDDGKLDYQDKQGLGNTIPKWTYGLNPKLNFKGFDLSMLFQGSADLSVYTNNSMTSTSFAVPSIHEMWKDGWTPQNTDTDVPAFRIENSWDLNRASDFWVHDISFVKLKNIQLGYTWPDNITSQLGLQEIYVYANAQNVFTIVDEEYPGYDPERNTFGSGTWMYPIPRMITMGVNLKF